MRNALWSVLLAAGLTMLSGCSGGSAGTSSSLRVRCVGGQAFCIVSCDLGCSQQGCSVTEIAENQRLHFKFSDAVDPASVNGAAISIRTATGVSPDGEFFPKPGQPLPAGILPNEVVFVPSVRTVNGISTFGFLRNESYIITFAGGNSIAQSVKNLAGDGLSSEFTCTVIASLGILDENQAPPTVELLSPTSAIGAPTNPTIVLRFSELIDTTPLQVSLGEASPIRILLRPTLPTGECDHDADGLALEGVPQLSTELLGNTEVSVVTFQPAVQLPGNSCVTINVTADLRDLSGRSAIPATFEFLTVAGVSVPFEITEAFTNPSGQIALTSGGVWGGAAGPGARPGAIGGDGRHGSFNPALGQALGGGSFVWNVDSFTIPATSSLTGLQYLVTDGRFYFTDFVVPDGTTIRFTGTVPPVIRVRGQIDVRGTIEVNGSDLPFAVPTTGPGANMRLSTFNARAGVAVGQPGTSGGCGGGRGGRGANECTNTGPIIVSGETLTDGAPGEDVKLLAGHAYAGMAGGTGGRGGELTPNTGVSPQLPTTQLLGGLYVPHFSPGGSGGGYFTAGTQPATPTPPVGGTVPLIVGTLAAAGAAFPLLPYPASPPAGYTSLTHFLVGGSGGGGGGSHGFALFGLTGQTERWMAGSGGSGGGGAFALRSGGSAAFAANASLLAKGGTCVLINGRDPAGTSVNTTFGISSPGGGGSGGSILVQSAQSITVLGTIDTRGAVGSRVGDIGTPAFNGAGQAGTGSTGYFRCEAGTTVAFAGTGFPAFSQAVNVGTLLDRDTLSGDDSIWHGTGLLFPPTWERYELDVDLDGNGTIDVTYTDSGAPGTMMAMEANGPVTLPLVIQFQGANLNQAGTEPIAGSVGPWRDSISGAVVPGISGDQVTGFRFRMLYNRGMFPNLVVKELRVLGSS